MRLKKVSFAAACRISAAACLIWAGAAAATNAAPITGPATQIIGVDTVTGLPCVVYATATCGLTPSGAASGKTAVTFSITSAAASSSFTPIAGRVFHLIVPAGTMSAACHLERQPDGTNWVPITFAGTELESLTLTGQGVSEDLYEAQAGVAYRLDCGASLGSYASGTVAGGFYQ